MADFIEQLSSAIEANKDALTRHLRKEASPTELDLRSFVRDHWLDLPRDTDSGPRPAFAIDGSMSQVDLDNGSYLVIAQSLCIGQDGFEESSVDVQILPPATPRPTAARFADLVQRHRELQLANEVVAHRIPEGGLLYLDGALYGLLPQLFGSPEDAHSLLDYPERVLDAYLSLLATAHQRKIALIAIAKTSREATHCKIWLRAQPDHGERELPDDVTDSGMIHRWTDGRPGLSQPVVLGTWSFTGGSTALLDRQAVHDSPAIVSFFVRLAEFDDALRIDLPAHQAGDDTPLGELQGTMLRGGMSAVAPMVELLTGDYGGVEVYNALLYGVDREVRLKRRMVAEVYLPLIGQQLESELRLDRSSRRFM